MFAEETADIFSAISETGGADAIETANEFLPGLADGLIGVAEFIEAIGGRLIVRKNVLRWLRWRDGDATGISSGEEDGRLYANLTIF